MERQGRKTGRGKKEVVVEEGRRNKKRWEEKG